MSSSTLSTAPAPSSTAIPTREQIDRERERRRCKTDIVHWVNTYGKTFDPRLLADGHDPTVPFVLFPKQVEFLGWIAEREKARCDGVAEKSRDVGFSWCCLAYALHSWLYRPGTSIGFGSREMDLVDKKGDLDSLFEKLRFLLRNLPEWMLPAGFRWNQHSTYCLLQNPANGSRIKGDGGEQIGRGGRHLLYFIDEAAHLQHPDAAEAALSATTRSRIYVSTPCGPGNPFARKRFSGKVAVFSFHWRDDPRKDEAWYRAECERLGDPVIIAQELDLDYNASVEGICIPAAWVRAAVELPLPPRSDGGDWADYPAVAGFDVAEFGRDCNVVIGRRGPMILAPETWGQQNTTESAHRAADAAEKIGATVLHYDCVGIGAGVRGTYDSSERELLFSPNAVNVGSSPTDTLWPDGKTSAERFLNLRAELWWLLRVRFEKTHEFVTQGIEHPPDELISLPNCPELIADLSLPLYKRMESGKVQLERKDDMRKRGVKSPNHGDALALTEARSRTWAAF